ncbi:MAG TPA: ATP-binding protein [Anaerolineae bacterium]|nr:ATP-binding protein [Anaerolineae bacterium]
MDLLLGRELKSDRPVYISAEGARAVFVCGKRGSGKSYTLGIIVEELLNLYGQDVVPIIVDPIGVYHTMSQRNDAQTDALYQYGLTPKALPVRLLVPSDPTRLYEAEVLDAMVQRGVAVVPLRLNPSDLSPDGWCDLFEVSVHRPSGIVLFRAVQWLDGQGFPYTVRDIADTVKADGLAPEMTQEALLNRLEAAHRWGIFTDTRNYVPIDEIFTPGVVNILDLSPLESGPNSLRNLTVGVIARNLFRRRMAARLREEFGLSSPLPRVWLCIDEAHQFVPSGRPTLAKEVLVRWVKEGRQPSLSAVLASQQPSAVDWDVLSQCDVILSHKLTNKVDISALNALSHDYMAAELRSYVRELERVGQAVLVDDDRESVTLLQIRPRQTCHGGGTARPEPAVEESIWE